MQASPISDRLGPEMKMGIQFGLPAECRDKRGILVMEPNCQFGRALLKLSGRGLLFNKVAIT